MGKIGKKSVMSGFFVEKILKKVTNDQRFAQWFCDNYAYSDFLILAMIAAIPKYCSEDLPMDTKASASCSGPFASYCRLRIMLGVTVLCLIASIGATIYMGG